MGSLIDFQKYKNKKEEGEVETVFSPPKQEGYCPFCQAPTLIKLTMSGTPLHTFDPNNMESYEKVRNLLSTVVNYFRQQDVGDEALVEAFGEGMAEFLKELEQDRGN